MSTKNETVIARSEVTKQSYFIFRNRLLHPTKVGFAMTGSKKVFGEIK
ncbi:MAG: hypothetical protein OQK64_06195 [Ignavibacteriaceae bacterium]|nr:hypothetical protein [Ignavibacteriaceae bacterium]MCW8960887.1 hypothetical protein [Ignavibacteriaceae bacterium]